MNLQGGETIVLTVAGVERKWRLSKIDNNLVKFFDENNNYTQMPYDSFKEIIENEHVKIESRTQLI